MSGVCPDHPGEHVSSHSPCSHRLPVLLAVPTCPMWFVSELNGKDHLERIHNFTEGRGYSFYDCLRQFGLEWFGRRSFFDHRKEETGRPCGVWMDLALASRSGGGHSGGRVSLATNRLVCNTYPSRRRAG